MICPDIMHYVYWSERNCICVFYICSAIHTSCMSYFWLWNDGIVKLLRGVVITIEIYCMDIGYERVWNSSKMESKWPIFPAWKTNPSINYQNGFYFSLSFFCRRSLSSCKINHLIELQVIHGFSQLHFSTRALIKFVDTKQTHTIILLLDFIRCY